MLRLHESLITAVENLLLYSTLAHTISTYTYDDVLEAAKQTHIVEYRVSTNLHVVDHCPQPSLLASVRQTLLFFVPFFRVARIVKQPRRLVYKKKYEEYMQQRSRGG